MATPDQQTATPDPNQTTTIAIGSCQLPTGIIDRDFGMKNWHDLAAREKTDGGIDSILLLGDQIYADPSSDTWDTKFLYEAYPFPYRRLLEFMQLAGVSAPVISMPDDHEFEDGWEPPNPECAEADIAERQERLGFGLREYFEARLHNYSAEAQARICQGFFSKVKSKDPPYRRMHFSDTIRGIPYFMCNTRLERDQRHAKNYRTAHLIKQAQRTDLQTWLLRHKDDFKLVASPAALFPRFKPALPSRHFTADDYPFGPGVLRSDSWDGYPATLLELLKFIADNEIKNTVFLSGDLHFASVSQIELQVEGTTRAAITSVHCSALYAPYPFANAVPDQFELHECFNFSENHATDPNNRSTNTGKRYTVKATTIPAVCGDGFCYLQYNAGKPIELKFSRTKLPGVKSHHFTVDPSRYHLDSMQNQIITHN